MSSDEFENSASESEEEAPRAPPKPAQAPAQKKKESKVNLNAANLDDSERELLEFNKNERDKIEQEIEELRIRSEKRKKQREEEEKKLAADRVAEDEKKKGNEEARKRQKIEDDQRKQKERALKLEEFEKWKTPQKRNFVITKREDGGEEVEETEEDLTGHKSKEQQEAEKKATLKQRIKSLDLEGLDAGKLAEKAKEIHTWLARLETDKYDLEKRLKTQTASLQDLAEKARQANKVGKGGLKRVGEDTIDKIQTKFAGAPAKVEMFSKYERQKDKRTYQEMYDIFIGPQFVSPPDRIVPKKAIDWDEERMPVYAAGGAVAAEAATPDAAAAN